MASLLNNLGGTLGFGEYYLGRNDDSYREGVDLREIFGSQGLNFFGQNYSYVSINNNGNVTFSNNSWEGLWTYTPFGLQQSSNIAMIAPFFADVDTRRFGDNDEWFDDIDNTDDADSAIANIVTPTPGGTSQGSNLVWYDIDTSGYGALTVTWDDVGYYDTHTDKLGAFQLQLIGTGDGNFDVVFRYEAINWVTGDASEGVDGLGGVVARAGYSDGLQNWLELPQSGNQSAMLDLENTLGNTGEAGYYFFSVNGGTASSDQMNGSSGDDMLSGGAGNDTLRGYAGNDALYGGEGSDMLYGGTGDDNYYADLYDTLFEFDGEGTDTVYVDWNYTLPNFIENLVLNGVSNLGATGNSLNNRFVQNAGDNTINGGEGVDTVAYYVNIPRENFALQRSGSTISVDGDQGMDTLVNVERLEFFDVSVAFDLLHTQSAGQTLEFIGVLAPSLIETPSVVGLILGFFDMGWSMQQLNQLAVDIGLVHDLAGGTTNADVARMAFQNVVGSTATADTTDFLVSFMDGRNASFSQSEFLATVAGLDVNQAHVNLVGLASTGVEYLMG